MRVHLTARARGPRGRTAQMTALAGRPRGRAPVAPGTLAVLAVFGVLLAGCGGSGSPSAVPSLGRGSNGTHATDSSRTMKLHAAAECIREHGIPAYADPVLTPSGAVYTDARPIQDASDSTIRAAQAACSALITQAGLHPEDEPPAPPQMVEAGVRAAECERQHGLPNVTDPTVRSPYTPGHGFGMTDNEVPGGKASHGFQEATQVCHTQVSAEIRASTLASLGSDG